MKPFLVPGLLMGVLVAFHGLDTVAAWVLGRVIEMVCTFGWAH